MTERRLIRMFDQVAITILEALTILTVLFIVFLLPLGDYLLTKK